MYIIVLLLLLLLLIYVLIIKIILKLISGERFPHLETPNPKKTSIISSTLTPLEEYLTLSSYSPALLGTVLSELRKDEANIAILWQIIANKTVKATRDLNLTQQVLTTRYPVIDVYSSGLHFLSLDLSCCLGSKILPVE